MQDTLASGKEFFSKHAVLIDLDSKSILAQKDYKERINPASMTKILTVLVAAEHLEDVDDLDDTLTITLDITDYGFRHKCSSAGFDKDETVTVRDLFYGTVLPSGAEAAQEKGRKIIKRLRTCGKINSCIWMKKGRRTG